MLNMKKFTKIQIIKYVLVFSVILYIGGIYTGININKILNIGIEGEIDNVKTFLDDSSIDIKNTLLTDYYSNNFNFNKCELLEIQVNNQKKILPEFWSQLPKRLEDYENTQKVTDEYISIKREYFRFSLRLWLSTTNFNQECEKDKIKPLLYFYETNCSNCIEFVEEIEEIGNPNILILPIQGDFEDDTIYSLKELYNISELPVIIYNYKIYKDSEELIKAIA